MQKLISLANSELFKRQGWLVNSSYIVTVSTTDRSFTFVQYQFHNLSCNKHFFNKVKKQYNSTRDAHLLN